MYHDIFKSKPLDSIPRSASMYHVSKDNFIRHLNIIKTSGCKVVTALDINNVEDDSVVITFDDGWKGSYEIALPILKEFEFNATFFVANRNVFFFFRTTIHINHTCRHRYIYVYIPQPGGCRRLYIHTAAQSEEGEELMIVHSYMYVCMYMTNGKPFCTPL